MIEIRPCREEADDALSLEIYNRVVPEEAVSREESEAWKASQIAHEEFVATLDDAPAGSAVIGMERARLGTALTLVTVLAEARGHGVGSALYRHASAWAREQSIEALRTRVLEADPASLEHARRRGFVEYSRERRMVLELARVDAQPAAPPEGIEIVRWAERPELVHGIHEVALESHPDVPGSEEWSGEGHEAWLQRQRPEHTFVALAGGEAVGFARLSVTAARPNVGVHGMTGVKRAFRRQGIGAALKRAQIVWAKEVGLERLETVNELRNDPIRSLNAKLGYRERPGRISLRGPLAT